MPAGRKVVGGRGLKGEEEEGKLQNYKTYWMTIYKEGKFSKGEK